MMSEIIEAIKHDNIPALMSLLQNGADLNAPLVLGLEYELDDPDEISPLFFAIRNYASIELIEVLLAHGVDIFEVDSHGVSALDVAIKFKRRDVVSLCLDKGFELNATKRRSGITPLMLAACFNDIAIIDLLLSSGADINQRDAQGMSAKDYAKRLGQKKVVEFLDSKGGRFFLYQEEQE